MLSSALPIERAITKYDSMPESRQKNSYFSAVKAGNVVAVDLFLRKGIDINCTDSHSMTALHWAVNGTNNLMVSFLIQHGADPNAICAENLQTPVILAARKNSVQILHYLIKHGGNDHYCDTRNVNILCYAVSNSAALTTEYLVCFVFDLFFRFNLYTFSFTEDINLFLILEKGMHFIGQHQKETLCAWHFFAKHSLSM